MGKCNTFKCRGQTESAGTKFCAACRSRHSRESDPVRYSYNNIKNRAKQRGKPFTITLAYFRRFCYRSDYIKGKGRTAESYTVDCKNNARGYVKGNLQVLTLHDNASKGARRVLNYDWLTGSATTINTKQDQNEENPF